MCYLLPVSAWLVELVLALELVALFSAIAAATLLAACRVSGWLQP